MIFVNLNLGQLFLRKPSITRSDWIKIGGKAIQTITQRLAQGRGVDDRRMKPLSPAYAARKRSIGSTPIRNMMFSGAMLGAMGIVKTTESSVVIGFTRRSELIKATMNQSRSAWYGLSKKDEEVVGRFAKTLISVTGKRYNLHMEFLTFMPEDPKEGTQDNQPQYLTKDEFGKSATYFRKVAEENTALKEMLSAIVEKGEDGSFRLKQHTATPNKESETDWQTELKSLKTEISKRDQLIAEKDRKAQEATKRSAIIDALAKSNAVNPQRDAVHLFDHIITTSEGNYVAQTKDDNGLSVETPLDAFVSGFLKSNPELVKATTKTGSGTPNGHSDVASDFTALSNMTPEQYMKHRKSQK